MQEPFEQTGDDALAATAEDEALNLAERLTALVGAWAGSLIYRWNPPTGPFFVTDGRSVVQMSSFASADAAEPAHSIH
jgi:hypothetical protein